MLVDLNKLQIGLREQPFSLLEHLISLGSKHEYFENLIILMWLFYVVGAFEVQTMKSL